MLYYYRVDCPPPKDLMEHAEVFIDKVQQPLIFTEPTPEEINLLSQNINSDIIVKKTAKKTIDGVSVCPDNRERDREERIKFAQSSSSTTSSSGEMIGRKPPGMSGVPSGPGIAGMFPDRTQSSIRLTRDTRPTVRNANSLFSRVSSYDETITRSNTVSSASILNTKKVGIIRSSTESSSTSSSNSVPNMFQPPWRTSTTTTNSTNNSTSTTTTTSTSSSSIGKDSTGESKSEWRVNSDASKNWRTDGSVNSSLSGKSNSTNAQQKSSSSATGKDLFDADDPTSSWDNHAREYLNRKRGVISGNVSKSGKPYNRDRRFDTENDLFKTKADTFDTFDMIEERDLFGSGRLPNSSFGGYQSTGATNDLFSGGRGKSSHISGRFNRGESGREYGSNDKWNTSHHGSKSYGSNNERDGRYQSRYQGHHYQRSSGGGHGNDEDNDRSFGGNSDDDEYRRSSLPEWSLEDPNNIDVTKVGTFDASGAFHEAIDDDTSSTIDEHKSKGNNNKNDNRSKSNEPQSSKTNDSKDRSSSETNRTNGDNVESMRKDSIDDSSSNRSSQEKQNGDQRSKQQNRTSETSKIDDKSTNSKAKDTDIVSDEDPTKGFIYFQFYTFILLIFLLSFLDDDSYAHMANDPHNLFSKFEVDDDGDSTALLTKQLSKLFTETIGDELKPSKSSGDSIGYLHDRFNSQNVVGNNSQSQQEQVSMFSSSSLVDELIGHEDKLGKNNLDDQATNDVIHQRLGSNDTISGNKGPLSMLNDNFNYNFDSNHMTSVSDASNYISSQIINSQSLFSKPTTRKISSLTPFDLESDDPTNGNSRIALSMMQSAAPQREHATEQSEPISMTTNSNKSSDNDTWFYRDPQGTVQGPFSSNEMYDWFVNGYFNIDLLVRRGCDTSFKKLGDLYQACGRVPFLTPSSTSSSYNNMAPNETSSNSYLFGSSMLNASNQHNHPQAESIVSPSANFLHKNQTSPPIHHQVQVPSSQSHNLPFSSLLDDISKPIGSIAPPSSLLFSNAQPPQTAATMTNHNLKEENLPSSILGGPLLSSGPNLLQRQQQQQQQQQQQGPTGDSQIANLLGIGPQNAIQAQAQLRLILAQLMKNDRFVQLTNAQQQQIVMDKFIQLNSQNLNHFHEPSPPVEQYNMVAKPPTPPTDMYNMNSIRPKPNQEDIIINQQQHRPPQQAKVSVDANIKPPTHVPTQDPFEHHHQQQQQHKQPNQPLVGHVGQRGQSLPMEHSIHQNPSSQHVEPIQPKPNPFQLLQAAIAAGNNSSTQWENIVPGAMSLSAVEELQRREAEERYKKQHQQPDDDDFIQKVDRRKHSKAKNDANKHLTKHETSKPNQAQQQQQQSLPTPLPPPTQHGGKVQMIDSKPEIAESVHIQNQLQGVNIGPHSVQPLPKKSVWGNPTLTSNDSPPLSIVEIQKIQEEKEREEEENRKRVLQQQMASFIANQQQQQANRSGVAPFKWASSQWQEQNSSKIKSLAEIQAEEAEKAAALRAQQEAETRRRIASSNTITPLSAIVAKNSTGSVWNSSSTQLFNTNASVNKNSMWDEDENPTLAAAASISNPINNGPNVSGSTYSKSLVKPLAKVDSSFFKHVLKAFPKTVKKVEVKHFLII